MTKRKELNKENINALQDGSNLLNNEEFEEDEILKGINQASQKSLLELAGSKYYSVRKKAMQLLDDQDYLFLIASGEVKGDYLAAARKLKSDKKLGDAVLKNGDLLGYKDIHERVKDKKVYRYFVENGTQEERIYALCQLKEEKELEKIALSDSDTDICSKALGAISSEKRLANIAVSAHHEKIRGYAAEMTLDQNLLTDIVLKSKDFIICEDIIARIYDQKCLEKIALKNGNQGVYSAIKKLTDKNTLIILIKKYNHPLAAFERLCQIENQWQQYLTVDIVIELIKRNEKNIFPYKDDLEILRRIYKSGAYPEVLNIYKVDPIRPEMTRKVCGEDIKFADIMLFEKEK